MEEMLNRVESHGFLLEFCRQRVEGIAGLMQYDDIDNDQLRKDLIRWQSCVDYLEGK